MNDRLISGELTAYTTPLADPECSRVAKYALAIFTPSVAAMADDFINDNVNGINAYALGFIKFCATATGLSDAGWVEACNIFFTNSMSLDPLEAAMHFRCAEAIMQSPEGVALFKAGQTAAWLCQEGKTGEAIAALDQALAAATDGAAI